MAIAQARFVHVFKELGVIVGADLMPDDNGVVTLTLGDDVTLSIEVPNDSAFIYFHSPVKRLNVADRATELEAAMRQNLFGLPLSGAWLALDSASDELLLCYSLLGDGLQADRLANVLEALAAAVRDSRMGDAVRRDDPQAETGDSSGASEFVRV
jgi:hypothetical protein